MTSLPCTLPVPATSVHVTSRFLQLYDLFTCGKNLHVYYDTYVTIGARRNREQDAQCDLNIEWICVQTDCSPRSSSVCGFSAALRG